MAASRDNRGRMKDPDCKIWLKNTEYLKENFSASLSNLVSTFYEKDLITEKDKSSLLKKARKDSDIEAASSFVDLLLNRGESILPDIIATLRESRFFSAADKLEKEMNAPSVDSSGSGKMNSGHMSVWKGSSVKLVENFKNHLSDLVDAFRKALILGDDDKTMIINMDKEEKCDKPSAAAEALVDALAKSGPDVLPNIIKVLHDKGFIVLAKELQSGIDELNVMKDADTQNAMQPVELQLWLRKSEYLVNKMKDKTPKMLDIFINAGIITQKDKAAIEESEQKEEPPKGTRKLVNMLAYRGVNAFSEIKEALKNGGYGEIIDNLGDVGDGLPEVPQDEPEAPENVGKIKLPYK